MMRSKISRSVLHSMLIGELGLATVLAGGTLAYRAYFKDQRLLQITAGLLLIAGFACLGVAICRLGAVPLR
jgi:hypothetical protein